MSKNEKYAKIVSDIRIAACGAEKPSSRLLLMQLAADAIEELLVKAGLWHRRYQLEHEKVEKLRSALPHWISVEERLPELHVNDSACVCTNTILYSTQYKTVHLGYVIETAHNIETIDGFEQIIVDRWYDQSGDMIEDVTHWMPLPAPPKED